MCLERCLFFTLNHLSRKTDVHSFGLCCAPPQRPFHFDWWQWHIKSRSLNYIWAPPLGIGLPSCSPHRLAARDEVLVKLLNEFHNHIHRYRTYMRRTSSSGGEQSPLCRYFLRKGRSLPVVSIPFGSSDTIIRVTCSGQEGSTASWWDC